MKVYIVQREDWGWENDAVFDSREKAVEYCIEYCRNHNGTEEYSAQTEAEDRAELEDYSYIDGIVAIETWEVE